MKKILLLAAAMLLGMPVQMLAQTDDTEEKKEDVITVTDKQGNEEEIEVPVGLEDNLDSLLHLYNAKTYMMQDTSCNYRDVNPVFDKEVYIDRLKRLPTIIEMPYNDVVQKFIDRYSGKLRRSVSYMLGAGNFYMPIFEEALEAYNLPLELKYLPVIESALNPTAVSRVGATGLWQFMIGTGKRYGLEVNSLIDERRDPVKSSYAAAHYLSDLYKIFDDWSLVIAAYNCGPDKVNKAIHRAKGSADYWNIYPYLPKETRGYVPAFIAANYIMNYYCEHNICPMKTKIPVTTDTVTVTRDLHMQQVAELCNIDMEAVHALNPQYRTDLIPGSSGPMTLCLPTDALNAFIDLKDSVYNYRAEELFTRRQTVEVDSKLDNRSVAARRRCSRSNSNDVTETRSSSSKSSKSSKATQSSKSSKSTKSSKSSKSKSKSKKKDTTKNVTVRDGDSLERIAKRNGTTVQKLKKLNNIKGNIINTGKKLRVK